MKWMLDHIRRLIAAYLQKPASGHEPITPPDPYQTNLAPSSEPRRSSNLVGADLDARRKELGVEDGLKELPGVTPRMLVTFAEHGINSVQDLADCATDYERSHQGWMVQAIKNAALAGLYLKTGNLTNSGKTLSSPETTAYSTVPTRCRQDLRGFATGARLVC
jgi:predicted flap endonuclease-1-like 5' DNA nuclease